LDVGSGATLQDGLDLLSQRKKFLRQRARTDLRGVDRQLAVDVALARVAQRHLGAVQQHGKPALGAGGVGQQRGDVFEPRPAQLRRDADVVNQLPLIHQQSHRCGVQFDPRDGLETALADGNLQRRKLQDTSPQGGFQFAFSEQQSVQAAGLPAQACTAGQSRRHQSAAGCGGSGGRDEAELGLGRLRERDSRRAARHRTARHRTQSHFRRRLAQRSLQRKASFVPARDLDVLSQEAAQLRAHIGPVVINFAA